MGRPEYTTIPLFRAKAVPVRHLLRAPKTESLRGCNYRGGANTGRVLLFIVVAARATVVHVRGASATVETAVVSTTIHLLLSISGCTGASVLPPCW